MHIVVTVFGTMWVVGAVLWIDVADSRINGLNRSGLGVLPTPIHWTVCSVVRVAGRPMTRSRSGPGIRLLDFIQPDWKRWRVGSIFSDPTGCVGV